MGRTVRFATVGSGWIADAFLEAASRTAGLRHTAVYSRSEKTGREFSARHGNVPVFTCLEALAESDLIDAAYIASPNSLHVEQSLLFLKNGKHVLCEKPADPLGDSADRLLFAAKEQNAVFMEALMPLYAAQTQAVRDALREIGPITSAQLSFCQYSSKLPAYLRGESPNVFSREYHGGALLDLGIYCAAAAYTLFGTPLTVRAKASFLENGVDAAGSAILEYPNFLASLNWSKIGQGTAESEIVGLNGSLTIGLVSRMEQIRLHPHGSGERLLFGQESHSETMRHEAAEFVRLISGGDAQEACRNFREVSALLRALRRDAGIYLAGEMDGKFRM